MESGPLGSFIAEGSGAIGQDPGTSYDLNTTRIIAVLHAGDRLGCAFLDGTTLRVGEFHENADFEALALLQFDLQPHMIVVSDAAPDVFTAACGFADNDIQLHSAPKIDFVLARGTAKIKGHLNKIRHLNSVLNLEEDVLAVRCIGGLLTFHDKHNPDILIHDFTNLRLEQSVHICPRSQVALGVFIQEGGELRKEGLSLYGILSERMKTPMAKKLLRSWLLRPINNSAVLENRLDRVSYFVSPAGHHELQVCALSLIRSVSLSRSVGASSRAEGNERYFEATRETSSPENVSYRLDGPTLDSAGCARHSGHITIKRIGATFPTDKRE